jgi:hypothetical protein
MNPLTTDIIVYFKSVHSNNINIPIIMTHGFAIKTFQYWRDYWAN